MGYADELFDLTDKVVLITGGSRGLGREMARTAAAGADEKAIAHLRALGDEAQRRLDATATALDGAKRRNAEATAAANRQIDQMRDMAKAVAMSSAVATAVLFLLGIIVVGKWIIQPLGWITFAFKQLAQGDVGYDVYETTRADEIGELGRAYAEFRRVTRKRQKQARETRLLAELTEWLQCCKSLDELYEMVSTFLTLLLPGCGGVLYVYANSRDVLDGVQAWNGGRIGSAMPPDDCWSLRRGRVFTHGETEVDVHCAHVDPATAKNYSCIPILAHGETIGMLHLDFHNGDAAAHAEAIAEQRQLGVVCAEQISMAIANVKLRDQLRDQSIRDPLTGLFNRRYLLDTCRREFARSARMRQSVSMLSIDVDQFKKFNDNHGHDAGDMVLRAVGDCLETSFRAEDIACRYGGEEFIVVLPGADPAMAARKAEELRGKIESLIVHYMDRNLPRVTISIGVAAFPACGDNPQAVIRAADEALYRAKAGGRNRIERALALGADPEEAPAVSVAGFFGEAA